MKSLVAIVGAALALSGCEPATTPVTNAVSKEEIDVAYVEKSSRVILKTKKGMAMEVVLPKPSDLETIKKIVASYNFEGFENDRHERWLTDMGSAQTRPLVDCPELSTESPKVGEDLLEFKQESNGQLRVVLRRANLPVMTVVANRSESPLPCVQEWSKPEKFKMFVAPFVSRFERFVKAVEAASSTSSKALQP